MLTAKLLLVATVWTYWNHEPADHLRRMSYSASSTFSIGEWLPQWYDRLHGEELIAKAASLGVDTVYCHYFKGFGLEHEREEIARTKDFVVKAHAHGVKVLGYCQLNSLYQETMLNEVPDLKSWTVLKLDGGIGTYGGMYYRWSPCIECEEFIDYIKKAVRYGIEEVGLDGFHFDNSYARDCHCERCQKAFRKYLEETVKNPREICGLANFRHVRLPPKYEVEDTGPESHDALQIWRQKFRHAQLARFHKKVFDYVKTFGKDKLTLQNPAYGRRMFDTVSSEVSIEPESCDFIMSENYRTIRVATNGTFITQVMIHKLGRRFGFRVFDSSWVARRDPATDTAQYLIPRRDDEISRFYAQGMIYGDIVGCPWLVRSTKMGASVILDDPVQTKVAGSAFRFYKANRARLFNTTPVSRTRLLYSPDTFYGWFAEARGFHSFVDTSERLNAAGVPYVVAAEDDISAMQPGDLLVLPDVRFMSRKMYDAIAAAGKRGVKIRQTGKAGQFDENGTERAIDNPIVDLRDVENKVGEVPPEYKVGLSSEGIMAETQLNSAGEFVLHLLRPGNESTIGELTVSINDPRASAKAELFSFEDGCSLKDAKSDGSGRTTLVIGGFRTMCSIAFRKN